MRSLLDGLFYLVRPGCQWRHLPPSRIFPPWRPVYGCFRAFLAAGVWGSMRHRFVATLREGAGREISPTAAIVDTQSVKTTEMGGPRGWGCGEAAEGARAPRRGGHAGAAVRRGCVSGRHPGRWPPGPDEARQATLQLAADRLR